jgi:hypothetical protein
LIEGSLLSFGAESIVFQFVIKKNIKITIGRTTVVSVALYGYEIWSFTLREERRLRVFENRVPRIFGPKRDEVTGEWRKLDNEELNDLYSSPNTIWVIKSRIISWTGHVAQMGERRRVYRVLVGKAEGRGSLGKPKRGWEDNIKKDLQEVGCRAWTSLIWLRVGTGGLALINAAMHLRVPSNLGDFFTS